ncbi:hypothetical protein P4O66_020473 [Electrophorus voltai]|uniref:Uncharacterized protein n=1 Tax=Electrophorus voltai TaxID=2609070 RepID=A0AAD9E2C6_9TELE|nr:hypothetical protein P4O66_020473 [Electrophorus voltai]
MDYKYRLLPSQHDYIANSSNLECRGSLNPHWQKAAGEAGKVYLKNSDHQRGCPTGFYTLPTVLLTVPLSQYPETTVIGLICDGDESAYRQVVDQIVLWSIYNNLKLNTVEMTLDFRRNPPTLPALTILDRSVSAMESFKFLGTTITIDLK